MSKEPIFPPYDTVGNETIYRTAADVELHAYGGGYFADINAHIHVFNDSITITDLVNALVPGQFCAYINVTAPHNRPATDLFSGLKTFADLYQRYYVERSASDDWTINAYTHKSSRVFTPFKAIKPISTPEKWTLTHVWKAILSGQVFVGTITRELSDDYAFDASANFFRGKEFNLPSLARSLVEEPGGWQVSLRDQPDGFMRLDVSCHHHEQRFVFFDEMCDWGVSILRREARERERCAFNADQLAKVIPVAGITPSEEACYDIQYLDMDSNTGRYVTKSALVPGNYVIEGQYLCCPIIALEQHMIQIDSLYSVASSQHHYSPENDMDGSFIALDNKTVYVTGFALRELLADRYPLPTLRAVTITMAQLYTTINDFQTGRLRTMCSANYDYHRTMIRWQHEMLRLKVAKENVPCHGDGTNTGKEQ